MLVFLVFETMETNLKLAFQSEDYIGHVRKAPLSTTRSTATLKIAACHMIPNFMYIFTIVIVFLIDRFCFQEFNVHRCFANPHKRTII